MKSTHIRLISTFLALTMLFTAIVLAVSGAALMRFSDVGEKAYYYDAVAWAVQEEITSGTSKTAFSPDLVCTRSQIVAFLWRMDGKPEPQTNVNPYRDVAEDSYYYKAVLWAAEEGVTYGIGASLFAPLQNVTREQFVTMLARYADASAEEGETVFPDVKSGKFYSDAVLWAYRNGITYGIPGGLFGVGQTCTRAEIVTFLYRYVQTVQPQPEETAGIDTEETTVPEPEETTGAESEETTIPIEEETTVPVPEETTGAEPEETTAAEPEDTTEDIPEETTEEITEETTDEISEETTESDLTEEEKQNILSRKYQGPYSDVNGTFAGEDALGREMLTDVTVKKTEYEKKAGIFYFLWMGQHGFDHALDNSIIEKTTGATLSESAWVAAGGGAVGETHFWGQPMFGYYTTNDTWVMRKHVQMLTDAGIDYVIFDCTNGYHYAKQALAFISILYEYRQAGFRVPQFAFYTNTNAVATIQSIYDDVYKAHPEYSELWFRWYDSEKPLIIGPAGGLGLSAELKKFFRVKTSQWPNEGKKSDGFPWMEFTRLLTDDAVYGKNDLVNISVAQHNETCQMSATAWYGYNDRTRSWHNGANDTSADAVLYGYNFEEQWNWALSRDVKSIFITGWNEWGAQRQPSAPGFPIRFVDCCTPNTSRDIEPMNGLFGDNYYMQMINGIRRFKGTADRVDIGGYTDVDFDNPETLDLSVAKYTDYAGDAIERRALGFGRIMYKDTTSAANDITGVNVYRDRENVYFRIATGKNLSRLSDENRMSILIRSGDGTDAVNGYRYVINKGTYDVVNNSPKMTVHEWKRGTWTKTGTCDFRVIDGGKAILIAVPRESIGLAVGCLDGEYDLVDFQFKIADGYDINDVDSFYKSGDAAPLGRLNYLYSNVK